jgi:hypothetical protein
VTGQSPYALVTPAFAFRALAVLAGRAPLGGPRETALATLVAARLALGSAPPTPLAAAARRARAEAGRLWLSSVTVPAAVRSAIARLVDASGGDDPRAVIAALAKVTDVTAPHLTRNARSELDRLGARLSG